MIDLPVDGVLAEARENVHAHGQAVTAEHPRISVAERQDAVGGGDIMSADDGILGVTPYRLIVSLRSLLPWHLGQCFSDDSAHNFLLSYP